MLPGPLISAYQQYKRDTDAVASWLASTAKASGYSPDLLAPVSTAAAKAQDQPSKRLKGKARKEAKKAGGGAPSNKSASTAAPSPKYVVAIKDFLPLAQFIASRPSVTVPGSFMHTISRVIAVRSGFSQEMSEHGADPSPAADSKHQFFVGVLEAVRDALKPRATPQTSGEASVRQDLPDAGPDGLDNRFAALELYEPSQEFLDAPEPERPQKVPGDNITYEAEPQTSFHDAMVAYTMMMNDVMKVRSRIEWIWKSHGDGIFDVAAAAIATNTAIDLVRHITEDIVPLFKDHGGLWKVGYSFYLLCCIRKGFHQDILPVGGKDNFNYETYEVADETYINAYRIVSSFSAVLDPKCLPLYKEGTFGTYDPASDRSAKSGPLKFKEDQALLMQFFTELMTIVRVVPNYPVQDEFLRGMKELNRTGEASFGLVFSAQIFLDIHHLLREKVDRGAAMLGQHLKMMDQQLTSHLEFHKDLKISHWPSSNDHVLRELKKKTEWIGKDPVYQAKSKAYQREGMPPPASAPPHLILRRSPVITGLMLYHMRMELYEVGIAVANAWGSIVYSAQLYVALERERLLEGQWQDMDVAMTLLRESNFWVGDRPCNQSEYMDKFCLQIGVSVAALKSRNGRRNAGSVASRSGPRGIKQGLPVSTMFTDRYVHNTQQVDWTPEHVDSIVSSSEYEQEGSEQDGTLQMVQIDEPGKLRDKKKARKKAVDGAVMAPEQLIRALVLALQSEVMELAFPYLFMHRWCWKLLRTVKESCDPLLRAKFGPEYMENESQLPFVVGYIFLAGSGQDGPKDDSLMEAAAFALNEFIGAGTSATALKILKTLFGFVVEFRQEQSESA